MLKSKLKKSMRPSFWAPAIVPLLLVAISSFGAGAAKTYIEDSTCLQYGKDHSFTAIPYKKRCYIEVGLKYVAIVPKTNEIILPVAPSTPKGFP